MVPLLFSLVGLASSINLYSNNDAYYEKGLEILRQSSPEVFEGDEIVVNFVAVPVVTRFLSSKL